MLTCSKEIYIRKLVNIEIYMHALLFNVQQKSPEISGLFC
jgi:hypothetical protein